MKRWLFFLYGVSSYLGFLLVYAYLAGFVGNFLVPKTIDSDAGGSTSQAVVIDVLLIGLFAAQHSIMARPAFKRVWTRIVPEPIERSTYVLIANFTTIFLMWQWRGIDGIVWDVQQPALRTGLWALFAFGWLLVPTVTLMIDHFDLFGTRQVWLYLRGRACESSPFRVPYLYKYVRHPLYLGWATAFWAIPTMTVGHLLFAGGMTVYMGLAAIVEERDLIAHFGQHYLRYRRQVPMFIPRVRSRMVTESIEAPVGALATDAEIEVNRI
ncbi:MAG TPA: isoprenylcysteine carboxylmethyltransferase family protein [Pirellulales bacterium]